MKDKMKDLMTPDEVAEFLGYTGTSVRIWLRKGLLRGRKLGREWVVFRSDLAEFTPPKRGRPRTRKRDGEEEPEYF